MPMKKKSTAWPKKNMVVKIVPTAAKKRKAPVKRKAPIKKTKHTTEHRNSQYSESSLTIYRKKSKQVSLMQKVSAPSIFVNNAAYTIVGVAGQQSFIAASTLDNTDLYSLYNLLPSAGSAAAGYGARRLVVDSAQVETTFTNTSTAPIEIEVLSLSLKKDLPQAWSYSVGTAVYGFTPNPGTYWYQGLNVASNSVPGTTTDATTPGSSPMDSQFFKDYFKIDRRAIVMLPQGGSHRHFLSFRPNTLVKEDEVGTSASSTSQPNFGLKRLNRWIMPIVRGLPVVNASTTPVSTTLGSLGLSMVQTYRYKYQFVLDCTSSFTGANSLTQPVVSSQKMINAGSGAYDIVDGNVV